MKNLMNKIAIRTKLAAMGAKEKLTNRDGDFILDHAMVFVIILIVGGISIALLVTYLQGDFSTLVSDKVTEFFN